MKPLYQGRPPSPLTTDVSPVPAGTADWRNGSSSVALRNLRRSSDGHFGAQVRGLPDGEARKSLIASREEALKARFEGELRRMTVREASCSSASLTAKLSAPHLGW